MYDELVKRLRDAAKMSEALAVLLPHSEGNAMAKLYNEAAVAVEELATNYDAATDIMKHQTEYIEELERESEDLYQRGLDDAWDVARRIISMDGHERAKAFFANCETATHAEPFLYAAQDAIQMLKQYDDIMHRVTHSNAQKFVEVFGFAPGYEILEDGREVYPSLNDEFWNAEYKPPEEEENA